MSRVYLKNTKLTFERNKKGVIKKSISLVLALFLLNIGVNFAYSETPKDEKRINSTISQKEREEKQLDFARSFMKKDDESLSSLQLGDKNLDVVLLLDFSGSMQLTDPKRLRDEGVRLFLEFLKEGDRVSIVKFADDIDILLKPSYYNKEGLDVLSQGLSTIANDGEYTDLYNAVKTANDILRNEESGNFQKVIILFSDGKMDPNEKIITRDDAIYKLYNELLPNLNKNNIKLYTLSFSKEAEKDLLIKMAEGTNSLSLYAENPGAIHEAFSRLFLAVKRPQILPISKKGLRLDNKIDEATFYINKTENKEVIIVTPSGYKIEKGTDDENVKWFSGNLFEIVTVKDPEQGVWKFLGAISEKDFATVLTRLKIVTSWANNIYEQEPQTIKIRIYDNNKPLNLPEINKVAKVAYRITPNKANARPILEGTILDDGKGLDKKALDGIFTTKVQIDEAGEYELWTLVKTPTFERHQKIPFRVRPKLVSLSVQEGETEDTFIVDLSKEATKNNDVKVSIIALTPSLEQETIALQKRSDNQYTASSKELKELGQYILTAKYESNNIETNTLQLEYENKNKELKEETKKEEPKETKEDEPENEDEGKDLKWLSYVLITISNLLVFIFMIFMIKKSDKKKIETGTPSLKLPKELEDKIKTFENCIKESKVNTDDDRFKDNIDYENITHIVDSPSEGENKEEVEKEVKEGNNSESESKEESEEIKENEEDKKEEIKEEK